MSDLAKRAKQEMIAFMHNRRIRAIVPNSENQKLETQRKRKFYNKKLYDQTFGAASEVRHVVTDAINKNELTKTLEDLKERAALRKTYSDEEGLFYSQAKMRRYAAQFRRKK